MTSCRSNTAISRLLFPAEWVCGWWIRGTGGGGPEQYTANPLAVITQIQPITVIFTMPEDSLGAVEAQLRKDAKLTVDAFDRTAQTKIASGKLLTLDNQIDTTTGTVKGRAVRSNDDFALFPNQFVNTRLLVNTLQGVTLIPSATIQQNGQTSFVYVIQDNFAHLRTIKPGVTDDGLTQVEGINPGDVVANSSFDKLQDNSKVRSPPTVNLPRPENREPRVHESIASIYLAAGGDLVADGRHLAGRYCRLYATAGLRIAASRLSDDSSAHVLSGRKPDVMATTVTAPLERQFGELQGLSQMTSTSSGGTSVIVLQFNLSLNIDVAEEEVQSAINARQSLLPSILPSPPIYSKTNPADAPVLTLAITSNSMPLSQVEDLVDTRLAPKISQLNGVGLVTISGGQKPAVRIQANPTALSSYGINLEDLAHRADPGQRECRQREFRWTASGLPDRCQRSTGHQQRLSECGRGLPQRRAGDADRRRTDRGWRGE